MPWKNLQHTRHGRTGQKGRHFLTMLNQECRRTQSPRWPRLYSHELLMLFRSHLYLVSLVANRMGMEAILRKRLCLQYHQSPYLLHLWLTMSTTMVKTFISIQSTFVDRRTPESPQSTEDLDNPWLPQWHQVLLGQASHPLYMPAMLLASQQ